MSFRSRSLARFARPLALPLAAGAATLILAGLLAAVYAADNPPQLTGFSPQAAASELAWEQKFDALPSPARLRADMYHLSALPHNLGSERDHENAEWILHQFQSYGLDAHIEEFDVLFPTPISRSLELIAPEHYTAQLKEPPVAVDPDSTDPGQLPTYNAYSPDGDVTSQLVYVNYGLPSDYDELAKLGISVKGKIVIARYGMSWRGIKPKVAAEHGAVGCLIYSDPRDDGYFQGDLFPQGPFRPWQGVQRGSVMMMEVHPGDPTTPGYGSVPGAKHEKPDTLEKIPVLPISYGDALPLLRALAGPVAPENWRGALPITYHVGPGPAVVHLALKFDYKLTPTYDVIARIPGSTWPDQWVIRGNHHDGWVNGAEDPISGLDAELEEARAYGALLKQGWRPKRTIIYCAWDGEEPGLLGSTEWAETHAAELEQHAVAYINSDTNDRGYLGVEGSHSLEHFFNNIAKSVTDPETGESVWERLRNHRIEEAKTAADKAKIENRPDLRIGALGSGSDYSTFLQHLGIASANLGYQGECNGGIYHSIYDDFYWYTHFCDGTYVYGRALSQTAGHAVMRLADADVLPFQFGDFADTIALYQQQLEELHKNTAGAPAFDFSPLSDAVSRLKAAAAQYDQAFAADAGSGSLYSESSEQLGALDQLLLQSERKLMDAAGLPRRPWYKHQIYAPGFYTGYGVKTLPGMREAMEQKNWDEAEREQAIIVKALDAFTAQIQAAAAKL